MKEIKVYLFTEDEATEILQNILDNKTLVLTQYLDCFVAETSEQELDASQIDERMAQYLEIDSCEHHAFISYNGKTYMCVIPANEIGD